MHDKFGLTRICEFVVVHRIRFQLGAFAGGWLVFSVATVFIVDELPWNPKIIAVLGMMTAVSTAILAVRPTSTAAYRLGGTFAVGALLFRVAAIALWSRSYLSGPYFVIVTAVLTLMFIRLYWLWWLERVGIWHLQHRRGPSG